MNSVIVTPGPQWSCAQAAAVSANAATAAHRARSLLALLAEPGAGSHLNLPFGNGQKIAPPGARCQSAARTKPIGLAACRCRNVFSRSTLSPAGGADGGRRAASDGPARQARSAGPQQQCGLSVSTALAGNIVPVCELYEIRCCVSYRLPCSRPCSRDWIGALFVLKAAAGRSLRDRIITAAQ